MESTFYISSGGQNKMYTLRCVEEYRDCDGFQKRKDNYVMNLSINYDKAVKKALDFLGEGTTLEGSEFSLRPYGKRADNFKWDGKSLCWGLKYYGWRLTDIVKEEFGIKYLAEGYQYPSPPRQADRDCLEAVNNLPEVIAYKKAEEDRIAEIDRIELEVKEKWLKSQFVGSEGDIIELSAVVISKFIVDGYYGSTFCIEFRDGDDVFTCFSNSKLVRELDVDDEVNIRCIVKGHRQADKKVKYDDEYYHIDNVKTTTITRIKEVV
jgi:hypothetical protein